MTKRRIEWLGRNHPELPIVLTIPHSGETIPEEAAWLEPLPPELLLTDVDRFVERFTAIVPFDERALRERVAEGGWYLRLVKGISRETVKRLEDADIDGVGIESYQVRHYPYGDLADDLLERVDVAHGSSSGTVRVGLSEAVPRNSRGTLPTVE